MNPIPKRSTQAELAPLLTGVIDPTAPKEARDAAAREIRAILVEEARRVAGWDGALEDELVEHAWMQILRGLYVPRADSSFRAWVATVMRRYASELRRRNLRLGLGRTRAVDPPAPPGDAMGGDLDIDLTTPFGRDDVARVAAWSRSQRLVLLPWWLLWRKVPEKQWEETADAAGLTPPFPGPDFGHLPPADRTSRLAAALGVKPNSITQALKRGRDRVLALRFVRELLAVEPRGTSRAKVGCTTGRALRVA